MTYRRSFPLQTWLQDQPASLQVFAAAHRHIGAIAGRGRPREIGRRLAHAYILQLVADFQGFARSLHDLAAASVVRLSQVNERFVTELIVAATSGRALDRGNADLRALEQDFLRLGIAQLNQAISAIDHRWSGEQGDRASFEGLIRLRNALAHGNVRQVAALRRVGILDTRTWADGRRSSLNRFARALDRVVWNNLRVTFQAEPW